MKAADCPFCGTDEPEYVASSSPSYASPRHWYECRRCFSRGPFISAEFTEDPQMQALAQWNLRAAMNGQEK